MHDEDLGPSEAAFILQWLGVALLLAYAITVLAAAYPLDPLEPAWQLEFCDSVRGGASFPIAGGALFVVALQFDPGVQPLQGLMVTIRRLALLAAIGFLLLIPLQTRAGVAALREGQRQDLEALRQIEQVTLDIRNATSEPLLRQAISGLPGAARIEGRRFNAPFEEVRDSLVKQLDPQLQRAEEQIRSRGRERVQSRLYRSIREGVMAAAYALGFAALGQPALGRPSLLESLSFHRLAPSPEPWEEEVPEEEEGARPSLGR